MRDDVGIVPYTAAGREMFRQEQAPALRVEICRDGLRTARHGAFVNATTPLRDGVTFRQGELSPQPLTLWEKLWGKCG